MKRFFILALVFVFLACENQTNQNVSNSNQNSDSTNLNIRLIYEYSNLIAGNACDTFENVQSKNFYKNYEKSISTTWNYFYLNQIMVIQKWSENNNITSVNDTATVFYPFSGPDFAFLNGFFPYAKNYILVGLENVGVVPDFTKYSDLEIEQYLNSLSGSMTNFFLDGYFSTQTMKYSFRSSDMNGVIHPLLFFINRMGQTITDLKYFIIDDYGKTKFVQKFEPLDKHIKGVKLTFYGNEGVKNLFYLQFDLSNQNFNNHLEFSTFISNFGPKNVFLKSASYLLHEEAFSEFKNLLNEQAIKILQDDSGFEYDFLNKSGYSINLYGNYSHTLNIFEKYWQIDLKNAFNSANTSKLPFRFGYNIPFDESALIFAYQKKQSQNNYPIYTIQFKMSWNKLCSDSIPNELIDVDYYFDEGYYKYISGKFSTKAEAENYLIEAKNLGFNDAFILKFDADGKHLIQ